MAAAARALRAACVALLAASAAVAIAPPPPSPRPPPLPPGASLSVSAQVVGELAFEDAAFADAYTPAVRTQVAAAVSRAAELPLTAVTVPFEFFSAELTLRLAATPSPVSDTLLAALVTAVSNACNITASLIFPLDAGAAGGGTADVALAVHTASASAASVVQGVLTASSAPLLAAASAAAGRAVTLVGAVDRAVVATFRAQLPPMTTTRTADAAAAVISANITDAVAAGTLAADFPALRVPTSLRQGPNVNKVFSVLDPSKPPPAAAPRRSPPPPTPPPPATTATGVPPYVGNLSKQELSAAIIGSAVGGVACCVATVLCACSCYRRGVAQAEAALERAVATRKGLATIPELDTVRIESEDFPEETASDSGAVTLHPAPTSLPPQRRTSRLSGGSAASGAEITPAAAVTGSPRGSATSSSIPHGAEAPSPRVSAAASPSRGAALLAEAPPAAVARASAAAVPEPEEGPPVPQPPAWATSSFDNPLLEEDGEAPLHDGDATSEVPLPPHDANAAAWHALGSPPMGTTPGHNPLFSDGAADGDDVAHGATPPRWEELAPAQATPEAFASPDAAFGTPGSVWSDAPASAARSHFSD